MRNFIVLGTFSSLFLSFIVVGAQLPQTYYIVNSVRTSTGDRLAATFEEDHPNVTVTPLTGSDVQRWDISKDDGNGAQYIIPATAQSKAAAAEDNVVVILPKDSFVWRIEKVEGDYFTIGASGPQPQFWGLDKPDDYADILLGGSTDVQTRNWVLELAD